MNSTLEKIKNIKKRYLYIGALVVVLIIFLFNRNGNKDINLIKPTFGELKSTVSATGVVTSITDLNLSFKKSGVVNAINVEVGSKVKSGQILARLSSGSEYAELSRARASVLSAEARLNKIIEGASNEEINLAKVSLENAKKDLNNVRNTQNTLVNNAYNNLLNSNLEAVSESIGDTKTPPAITGSYALGKEGQIKISVYGSQSGVLFSTSGLITSSGVVNSSVPQAIGNSGLYISFSSTSDSVGSSWIINLPNKKGANYLTNENAYNQALKTRESAISTAESLVAQREAELSLKQAQARKPDIELGEADVLSAKASLSLAASNYEDTLIRAPKDGTITKLDIKQGELASPNNTVIVVKDVSNLYVEALINESNISSLKLNQKVLIKFDALPDRLFNGEVSHIDPSSLASDGVVNFKIKVSILEKDNDIKPGMNSEISILIDQKQGVLAVPKAALINKEGNYFVNKITNIKKNKYQEFPVQIGITGDGNLIEITEGLSQEDSIVILEKK